MSEDGANTSGSDAIALLVEQHHQIRSLFSQAAQSTGEQRADAFFRLRRLLAVHESAEEEFVHPRCRWVMLDGDRIANARVQEETAAKEALVALEKLDVDSADFTAGLGQLRDDVLAHADAEESEEFARLADALDDKQLRRMRHTVQLAEKLAPSRPHPSLALGGENALAGGFAMMLDRARDLFSKPSGDQ